MSSKWFLFLLLLVMLLAPPGVDAKKVKRKHRRNAPAQTVEEAAAAEEKKKGEETAAAEARKAEPNGDDDEEEEEEDVGDGVSAEVKLRYGFGYCRKPDETHWCGYWGEYQIDLMLLVYWGPLVFLISQLGEWLYPEGGKERSESSKRFHATWRRKRHGGLIAAIKEALGIAGAAPAANAGLSVEEARAKLVAKQQRALSSKPMDERTRLRKLVATKAGAKAEWKAEKEKEKSTAVFDPLKGITGKTN